MKLTKKIISHIEDPLKWFRLIQRIIACVCILIPLILRLCDHDRFNPVRISSTFLTHISNCQDSIAIDTCVKRYKLDRETRWIIKDCRTDTIVIDAAKIKMYSLGFRGSLSNYAYSSNSYMYGLLYCMAALLFIYNGIVHIKIFNDKSGFLSSNLNARDSWCYIIIGLSLIMEILNPMHNREIVHYIFSVLFFSFNIYALAFLPNGDVKIETQLRFL